jgi:hypothetical protein
MGPGLQIIKGRYGIIKRKHLVNKRFQVHLLLVEEPAHGLQISPRARKNAPKTLSDTAPKHMMEVLLDLRRLPNKLHQYARIPLRLKPFQKPNQRNTPPVLPQHLQISRYRRQADVI